MVCSEIGHAQGCESDARYRVRPNSVAGANEFVGMSDKDAIFHTRSGFYWPARHAQQNEYPGRTPKRFLAIVSPASANPAILPRRALALNYLPAAPGDARVSAVLNQVSISIYARAGLLDSHCAATNLRSNQAAQPPTCAASKPGRNVGVQKQQGPQRAALANQS